MRTDVERGPDLNPRAHLAPEELVRPNNWKQANRALTHTAKYDSVMPVTNRV